MDYYDGNTVTGMWNYAQRFAMSDNFWATGFGPSTPGALNLISGQTYGGTGVDANGNMVSDPSVIGSPDASGIAGSLNNMFDWSHPDFQPLLLNPATGEPGH